MKLLDEIELTNGKKYIGIVDYVDNKHVYFFDFTQENQIDFLTLSILWKGYHPDIRFSVYCGINYPNLNLPRVILIPIKSIENNTYEPTKQTPTKRFKRIVRVESCAEV